MFEYFYILLLFPLIERKKVKVICVVPVLHFLIQASKVEMIPEFPNIFLLKIIFDCSDFRNFVV